jgi:hypothetical protein
MREMKISERIANKEILVGLAEIATFAGMSIGWTRQAIKRYGLPATRKGNRLVSSKYHVQRWIQEGHVRLIESHDWDTQDALADAAQRLRNLG